MNQVLKYCLTIAATLLLISTVNAQSDIVNDDEKVILSLDSLYGSDPFLLNGIKKLDHYDKFSGKFNTILWQYL